MTATSIGRVVVQFLVLVVAGGAALVFGITHVQREPSVETRAATVAPAVSLPASGARDEGSAALATAQAEASTAAAELTLSPRSPDTDESVPVFDIARIERTGDAVIAGRAAPGAIVELFGERHDRAVADQSGQFVMVPPRLLSAQARACSPNLVCILQSGRTLLFHSCCTRLPPPLGQMAAHRPPWSCPRWRPQSYPVATAYGRSAVSPTARACDTWSFTQRTATKSEIQIVFIPVRSLSFL